MSGAGETVADEILDTGTVTVENDLLVKEHPNGYRQLWRGTALLAMDSDEDYGRAAKFYLGIRERFPDGCTIALLGCGFGLLPQFFASTRYIVDVYEVEAALRRYADPWPFIPGRWQDTLLGTYDAIVLDTGEDREQADRQLQEHLNPGGIVLPAIGG